MRHAPPPTDPTVPALAPAAPPIHGEPTLSLAARPATAAALAAWHAHVFDRDSPLSHDERAQIARWVATWLGDPRTPSLPGDPDLHQLTRLVTLAPWQLDDSSFAPLRARHWDDAKLFDAVVTATTAGVASRIHVALTSLERPS